MKFSAIQKIQDKNFVVIDLHVPFIKKSVVKIIRKILIELLRNQFEYSDFHFYDKIYALFKSRFIFAIGDKVSQQNNIALNREISKIIQRLKIHTLKNEYQKIKTIYNYVRENVGNYDYYSGGWRSAFTAYGAAVEGKAVDEGVSSFVFMLCREAGIPARKIRISRKGSGNLFYLDHAANIIKLREMCILDRYRAANIVKLGGKWYVLDATKGMETRRYKGEDPYFLSNLKAYLQKLHRDDEEILVCGDIDFKDTDDWIPFLRLDDPEALGRYPMSQHRYQEEIVN